jgi:hypothetical protein
MKAVASIMAAHMTALINRVCLMVIISFLFSGEGENFFNGDLEMAGYFQGDDGGGDKAAYLNGADGFTGDADCVCKIALA